MREIAEAETEAEGLGTKEGAEEEGCHFGGFERFDRELRGLI